MVQSIAVGAVREIVMESVASNFPQSCTHERHEQSDEGDEQRAILLIKCERSAEDSAMRPVGPEANVDSRLTADS